MKINFNHPVVIAVGLALVIFGIFAFMTIPMLDGYFFYDKGLVHIKMEGKIALRQLWGAGLDEAVKNGIIPTVKLKPMGYVILVLVHIGLPTLVGIRFAAQAKNPRKKNGK